MTRHSGCRKINKKKTSGRFREVTQVSQKRMARSTRSKSETNENIRKYLLTVKKRNINTKKKKMVSEATIAALTAALEAMTNQGATNSREFNIKLEACPIKR